jgi:hypothetical protein
LLYGKTDELFLFSRYAKKLGVGDWDFSMNVYKLLQDTMILISAFKVDDEDRFVFLTSIDELARWRYLSWGGRRQYDL